MLANTEAYKPIKSKDYRAAIEQALAAIRNRQFSYRAEDDSSYLQHMAKQSRLARRAAEDAMAQAAALNGGRIHSFAQQLAQQKYNEGIAGIGDILPALQKQARDAYESSQKQALGEVEKLIAMEQMAQREYEQALDAWQKDRAYEYKKQQDALKRADALAKEAAKGRGRGGRKPKKVPAVVSKIRTLLAIRDRRKQ